jgi:hypothetical protein
MLPFLPALLGAGLQTQLGLTALQAGLATGLGTAIATKDISKGLTAGLGAYGGAGFTEGLGQAGQAASAAQAGQTATTAGSIPTTVGPGIDPMSSVGTSIQTAPQISTLQGSPLTGADLTKQAATQYANLPTSADRLASVQQGFSSLGDPSALQAAGGAGKLTMSGLTALTPTLEQEMDYTMPGGQSMIRPSSYDPSTQMFTDLEPYPAMRAGGTIPGLASQVRMNQGGRYLSGNGDGMSDSIKANIDGTMEARLSDGEFVVPADVVSGLGNGSSDAGADRLYTMMDRVRKERTGTTRQAPEINARSTMPA